MENKKKSKPGEQAQSSDLEKVNQQRGSGQRQGKEQQDLSTEEERNEDLEETHRSKHQPLPGEGTDEANGISDGEAKGS